MNTVEDKATRVQEGRIMREAGSPLRDRFLICASLFEEHGITTVLVDREGQKSQAVISAGDQGHVGMIVPPELQAEMEQNVRAAITKLRLLPAEKLSGGRG